MISAACTMMSMYGVPISSTEAAIRSHVPSVYVTPQNTAASDIISIDWPPVQTAPYTYWAVHNWNQGGEGGGYVGFQQQSGFDQTGKRTLHFALWDPIASNQAIKAEYLSPTSEASRFGGEGTGLKVQTTYNWKDSEWYRMTLRSWQEDGHTKFGQWIKDNKLNQWKLVAIMDHPVANVAFNYGLSMFQEDWAGNGQDVREARLKNGYSRKVSDKQWNYWNNQRISWQHDTSYQYDGGATSEYVWVKAGGNTQSTIGTGKTFNINQPSQPEMGNLDFDIQNIRFENEKLNVSWKLKEQSTPQFKGKIEIYDNEKLTGQALKVIENIKSYQTEVSQTMQLPQTAYAKITLTDIFDQTVEKKVGITNGNSDILVGNQFAWSLKGISDFEFAKINFNKSTEEMKIDLKAGVPHHYFNETYASIKLQNASGKVVYKKDIYGNKKQNAESQKVPVKVGDYIELIHLEGANRATITNMEKNIQESFGNKAVYEITKEGLKKVDNIVNPKPDTEAPTQPQGLYASNVTSNSVELKWNPATDNVGVKGYQILRDGQLIQIIQGTKFIDQNLTANKEYKYTVKAVDIAGNTSVQSNILPIKTKDQNVSYEKWDPKKAYIKGDKVEHQGKVYEAVQNHQGNGDPNWIFAVALWKPLI
ncbi:chitin-binding protein [Bacillus toyonensis]|nr:chitin-binding protein [Bacillus toyonensis]